LLIHKLPKVNPSDFEICPESLLKIEKSFILSVFRQSKIVINYNSDNDDPLSITCQF